MKKAKLSYIMNIRLGEEDVKRLEYLEEKFDVTKSEVIRHALKILYAMEHADEAMGETNG